MKAELRLTCFSVRTTTTKITNTLWKDLDINIFCDPNDCSKIKCEKRGPFSRDYSLSLSPEIRPLFNPAMLFKLFLSPGQVFRSWVHSLFGALQFQINRLPTVSFDSSTKCLQRSRGFDVHFDHRSLILFESMTLFERAAHFRGVMSEGSSRKHMTSPMLL